MARKGWLEIVALVAGVAIVRDLTVALDLLLRDRVGGYASLGTASIVAIWGIVLAGIAVAWPRCSRPAIWPPQSVRTLRNALVAFVVMGAVDWLHGFAVVHVVTGEVAVHLPASWVAFVAIAVAGPVVEEWLFRGVLWDAIASRTHGRAVTLAPMAITSLLFGAWHWRWMLHPALLTSSGTPVELHVAFGVCMAVLRWRFRSLGPGLIVHGIWNAIYPLTT